MSSDHQDTCPPATTTEFHRQPPPSTAGNNLTFTKPLPHTPPPMTPTNINPTVTNSTPESRLAAALGRAFFNIPPSSFQDAATTNPLLRTLSDADSSANQTTTTPPKVPRNNRTPSDTMTADYQQTGTKNPLRRTLSNTNDNNNYNQQPLKTPRSISSSPQSEIVLKQVEDMVREIEQRCWEIMHEEEEGHVEEKVHHPKKPQEQEESVGVERLKNGDLRFELSCCCGKRFQMLIKHNGYCFYRFT